MNFETLLGKRIVVVFFVVTNRYRPNYSPTYPLRRTKKII